MITIIMISSFSRNDHWVRFLDVLVEPLLQLPPRRGVTLLVAMVKIMMVKNEVNILHDDIITMNYT